MTPIPFALTVMETTVAPATPDIQDQENWMVVAALVSLFLFDYSVLGWVICAMFECYHVWGSF